MFTDINSRLSTVLVRGKSGANPVLSRNGERLFGVASPIARQDFIPRRNALHLISILFLFLARPAKAEAEFNLPPIVMEGAPAEALQNDPILPSYEEKVPQNSGTGGIV